MICHSSMWHFFLPGSSVVSSIREMITSRILFMETLVNLIYSFLPFSWEVLGAFRPLVLFKVDWSLLCRGFKAHMPSYYLSPNQPTIGLEHGIWAKQNHRLFDKDRFLDKDLQFRMNFIPNIASDWFVSGLGFPFTLQQSNSSGANGGSLNFETLWYKSPLWLKPSKPFIFISAAGHVKNFSVPSRPHKRRFANPYIQLMALNCVHYWNLYSEQIDFWPPRKLATKCDWLSITQLASNISSEYNF